MSYVVTTNSPFVEFTSLKPGCPGAKVRFLKVNLRDTSAGIDKIVWIGTVEMLDGRYVSLIPVTKSEADSCAEGSHEYVFAAVVPLQPIDGKPVQTCVISLCGKCHNTIISTQ